MKAILLILVVFANGQGQTAAIQTESEAACEKRILVMREEIAAYNLKNAEKIVYYAMACSEPRLTAKAPDS